MAEAAVGRQCVLVQMGATADGVKDLIAVRDGTEREIGPTVFKLCQSAERHWRKLNGCSLLRDVSEAIRRQRQEGRLRRARCRQHFLTIPHCLM
jgi:hypothetical protein